MGIQINGNTNNINAGIGSLSIEDINELDIVGVATAANFKTGVSNLHSVGLTLSGGQIDVGSNIKIGTAGVITATSFSGSGSALTGIDTDLVSDTSPQLGGDLDVNNFNIKNGTAILDISTNQRFEFDVAGTEIVDINGGGLDLLAGNLVLVDNVKAKFGSSGDMEIYHDGTDNYIRSNNGAIILRDDTIQLKAYSTTDTYLSATNGGGVSLRYDNGVKFVTTNTGAVVTGILTATTISSTNVVNSTQLSHRNKIINGAIQIWQRGGGSNNYSGSHDGYYAGIADRWAIRAHSSMGTQTYDKSPNCPQGFSFSQRIYTTSADGGNAGKYYVFDTKLEGQDLRHFAKGLSNAKPFTLSFYVKCNINRVFTCELRDLDNNRMCVQQYTTTDSNWKRYVLTFPADTTGQFNSDNGASLWVRFWLSAGANFKSGTSQTTWGSVSDANICPGQTGDLGGRVGDYWYITGIQLEVGSEATPFEHKSFIEDKLRCYRYYYQPERGSYLLELHGQGHRVADTLGAVVQAYPWPVEMRATPSVSYDDNAGNSNRFAVNGSNNSTTNNVALSLQQNVQGIMGAFQYPHGIANISENESFRLWAYRFNASAEL